MNDPPREATRTIRRVLLALWAAQLADVLRQARSGWVDLSRWDRRMAEALWPAFYAGALAGWRAESRGGVSTPSDSEAIAVTAAILAATLASRLNRTTARRAMQTVPTVSVSVGPVYGMAPQRTPLPPLAAVVIDPQRSGAVAHNEAWSAYQGGRLAWHQSNATPLKRWRTQPGCCDPCRRLNGVTLPLDAEFIIDAGYGYGFRGAHPPLHPNCRCDLEFIDSWQTESTGERPRQRPATAAR